MCVVAYAKNARLMSKFLRFRSRSNFRSGRPDLKLSLPELKLNLLELRLTPAELNFRLNFKSPRVNFRLNFASPPRVFALSIRSLRNRSMSFRFSTLRTVPFDLRQHHNPRKILFLNFRFRIQFRPRTTFHHAHLMTPSTPNLSWQFSVDIAA